MEGVLEKFLQASQSSGVGFRAFQVYGLELLFLFFLRCSFGKSFVASLSPFTPPHGAMSLNEASPGNLDEWVQIE